ncbi:peptide ABC transporter permease [Thermococcus litoralis DSM 5473]|uniref:Peptide ABC transporter permease n=1 Tax=Thermococcus litoralis (strain ATCC 51850 / DSM 5473 / JCM 8560 / NS-C) TaxID=523849 RepID=H3ZR74_THELN|nr:ABC transporter permease [Thermococcus litoralis]EHR77543.1 peptide ABC transporter permease [Thermococcus litoralis DSM 5473]
MRRRKVGIAILLVLLVFVVISNISVSEEDTANWENISYWKDNPRRAYPSWFSLFSDKTPTVLLKPSITEENGLWVYRFSYNHTYHDKPSDVRFYGLPYGEKVEISVLRPDGRLVPLYYDSVIYTNLSLNSDMRASVVSTLSNVLDLRGERNILFSATQILFSKDESMETLNGEYIFEIRLIGNATPSVEILGTCYGILGTDSYGRDIWVGFVKGMNNTLYLAFFTTVIIVVLGVLIGLLSGYISGALGEFATFLLEVLVALPMLPILVVLVWLFSTQSYGLQVNINPFIFMFLVAILTLGKFAKTIRMIVIKEKVNEYVKAAVSMGAGSLWVLRRHILPPVKEFSLRYSTILLGRMVALVSVFGFFGLIPGTNWGSLMIEAMEQGAIYGGYWWWIVPPGIVMAFLSAAMVLISSDSG